MRTLSLLTVLLTLSACSSDSKKDNTPNAGSGGEGPNANAGAGGSSGGSGGAAAQGGAGGGGGSGGATFTDAFVLPEVYPRLLAATPTTLAAGSASANDGSQLSQLGTLRQPLEAGPELAGVIKDRFYSSGPTDLLRIVKTLDERVQGLDLDPEAHSCLTSTPVSKVYVLPEGQTFEVKLQCLQTFGTGGTPAGWVGFGFAEAAPNSPAPATDAGADDAGSVATVADDAGAASGRDFYLIEGQPGGNGGAYHIDALGNVEAWVAVAERNIPSNSQVLMHLKTVESASTLELALAGSGVGFCSAHLKTNPDLVYTEGKTNAPPPPGEEPVVGVQYCNALSGGCFQASALDVDLGAESETCAPVAASSFAIAQTLDADTSGDAGTNVDPAAIYEYFGEAPDGIPAF